MPALNIENWIKENLFNIVPTPICVIDQNFNIVYANKGFEKTFGQWENQRCYSIFKYRDTVCPYCKWPSAYKDGVARVHKEVGFDKDGRITTYVNHTIPIIDDNGDTPYLVAMTIDTTEADQCHREHNLLFDVVPCSILLIDRTFHIVKSNQRLRDEFGEVLLSVAQRHRT